MNESRDVPSESIAMAAPSPLRSYLQVHPVGFSDALRLYTGYAAASVVKLLAPSRFRSAGLLIPGTARLSVSVAGARFRVRPRTNDVDLLSPRHEFKVASWFQVRRGEVVVDVGAHIGRYAIRAAIASAKVVAIEPDPANFSLLEEGVKLNRLHGVVAVRKAVSGRPGVARLFLAPPENTGISSLEPSWQTRLGRSEKPHWVEVECETLDAILASLDIRAVDWLKIDVEGHEVSVLEGARSTLSRTSHLILEVAVGNETACSRILVELGLSRVDSDEGYPTGNWLLARHG